MSEIMARSKSSNQWLKAYHKDPFVQQAKAQGLRGRAAFKLQEIQDKYRLFHKTTTVLDLGAAPGSWSQLLSQWVSEGTLVACDLKPIPPIPNVTCIQGDFTQDSTQEAIHACSATWDIIVCDMAPNSTGHAQVDQWQAGALTDSVFAFCHTLKPGGTLVIKLFHGSEFEGQIKWMRQYFKKVKTFKPKSSRAHSKEIYAIAQHYQAP